ncbi:MAG: hypothetical protein ACTHM6_18495 [Tepidisphaeraceae bacterium]
MKDRAIRLTFIVSTLCFVASATWFAVAASTGRRLDVSFLTQPHTLALSGGRTAVGTSGYSLCTDRDGLKLFYTGLSPVVTGAAGPDAKPIAGNFDVSVDTMFEVPLWALVLIAAATGLLAAGLGLHRIRRRRTSAFPIATRRMIFSAGHLVAPSNSAAG